VSANPLFDVDDEDYNETRMKRKQKYSAMVSIDLRWDQYLVVELEGGTILVESMK